MWPSVAIQMDVSCINRMNLYSHILRKQSAFGRIAWLCLYCGCCLGGAWRGLSNALRRLEGRVFLSGWKGILPSRGHPTGHVISHLAAEAQSHLLLAEMPSMDRGCDPRERIQPCGKIVCATLQHTELERGWIISDRPADALYLSSGVFAR